jgi:hypothetical protein
MFAVNGPSGPTSRNERRVRSDTCTPTKEELALQRTKRESFFQESVKTASSIDKSKGPSKGSNNLIPAQCRYAA